MSDPTVDPQDPVTPEPTTEPDPLEELLGQIVDGEGKPKYDSVEKALQGNAHAQKHISTLEEENETLRKKAQEMEDVLKQLRGDGEAKPDPAPAKPEPQAPEGDQAMDIDSLFEKFQERLTAKQQAEQAEQNKRKAVEAAQAAFGEKTAEVIKERAAEAGMDYQDLLNLAARSPKAFDKIIGIGDKPKGSSSFTRSSVNTAAMPSNGSQSQEFKNPLLSGKTKDAVDFWNSLGKQN
jgi:hypothetical protein